MAVNIYTTPIYTIFDILINEWFAKPGTNMKNGYKILDGEGEEVEKIDLLEAMIKRLIEIKEDL